MPSKLDKIDLDLRAKIALRFRELRQALNKTQEQLASEAGRDKQAYNKNETGKGASIYTINKFCLENNITLSQFFDSDLFTTLKKSKHK